VSNRTLEVHGNRKIPVFQLTKGVSLSHKKAKDLEIGDVIFVIDPAKKATLSDVILECLDSRPENRELIFFVQFWRNTLISLYEKLDFREDLLLEKLRSAGSTIKTEQTIKNWVNGDTVGPHDFKNLQVIAEVADDKNLEKYLSKVIFSIRKLRGIHTSFMRVFNGYIYCINSVYFFERKSLIRK